MCSLNDTKQQLKVEKCVLQGKSSETLTESSKRLKVANGQQKAAIDRLKA